jgi:hypothetical protein
VLRSDASIAFKDLALQIVAFTGLRSDKFVDLCGILFGKLFHRGKPEYRVAYLDIVTCALRGAHYFKPTSEGVPFFVSSICLQTAVRMSMSRTRVPSESAHTSRPGASERRLPARFC